MAKTNYTGGVPNELTATQLNTLGGEVNDATTAITDLQNAALTVEDAAGVGVANVSTLRVLDSALTLIDLGGGVAALAAIETLSPGMFPLGVYGDDCNGGTVDPRWTGRNLAATATGAGYVATYDEKGDALTQSFTDTGDGFIFTMRIQGIDNSTAMLGFVAVDDTGAGVGCSTYSGGANTYLWNLTGWGYSGTGPNAGGAGDLGDHWLQVKRDGSSSYTCRYWKSAEGVWSGWSSVLTRTETITHVGIVRAYSATNTATLASFKYLPN